MDEYLKKMVTELGEAINSAVNESEAVNDALDRLRASGHEAFLVLEATIAFKEPAAERAPEPLPFAEAQPEALSPPETFSPEDRQFLKGLKITFDSEGEHD